MKWKLFLITLSVFSFANLFSQEDIVLETANSCGIEIDQILITQKFLEFSSNSEASEVMNNIMKVIGLRPNYTVQAADVPNAAAVVIGQSRYILYNPKFIKSVNKSTNSDWSSISILAHELGHHLNGHTLSNKGSRPRMELEADEFSGFVLRKLGATLEEAQIAMNLLASPYGSASHPARGARLDAIQRGWESADDMIDDYSGSSGGEQVSTNEPTRQNEEHTSQNSTERVEEPETNNAPRPAVRHPSYAKYVIKLNPNPDRYYYLTHGNDFVTVSKGRPYPIGRLERNYKDENYPNVIRVDRGEDLFISKEGKLFTSNGKAMGQVNRIE